MNSHKDWCLGEVLLTSGLLRWILAVIMFPPSYKLQRNLPKEDTSIIAYWAVEGLQGIRTATVVLVNKCHLRSLALTCIVREREDSFLPSLQHLFDSTSHNAM